MPWFHSALSAGGDTPIFMAVHLMGSHIRFSNRYPAGFARFSGSPCCRRLLCCCQERSRIRKGCRAWRRKMVWWPADSRKATYAFSDTDRKWYDVPLLIDLFNAAGYRTFWISNQEQSGLYGNATTDICRCVGEPGLVDGIFDVRAGKSCKTGRISVAEPDMRVSHVSYSSSST